MRLPLYIKAGRRPFHGPPHNHPLFLLSTRTRTGRGLGAAVTGRGGTGSTGGKKTKASATSIAFFGPAYLRSEIMESKASVRNTSVSDGPDEPMCASGRTS